jgi:hypothetical protein
VDGVEGIAAAQVRLPHLAASSYEAKPSMSPSGLFSDIRLDSIMSAFKD